MSPGVTTQQADALERARRIHAEELVADSPAPSFTCGMRLTPATKVVGRTFLRGLREACG